MENDYEEMFRKIRRTGYKTKNKYIDGVKIDFKA